MPSITVNPAGPRGGGQRRITPVTTGTPDPRPLTEYEAGYAEVGGNSRVTIKLAQPCVVRTPAWQFVDCNDGSKVLAAGVTVVDHVQFYFDFDGLIPASIALVDVPYQDMQVQNFQGGFVRPGGQWFRQPG